MAENIVLQGDVMAQNAIFAKLCTLKENINLSVKSLKKSL